MQTRFKKVTASKEGCKMMCFRLWVLAIVTCGVSLTNVSCISVEDNASVEIREEGFFTGEVNALIDANYPEVMANGYAELVIPSTMFDLTINSVYYDYQNNTIIDYHGGLHDLRDKVVRTVYDANTMYPINASALIRTVRFAARYGFDIDAATTTAIADNMHDCRETITAVWDELETSSGQKEAYEINDYYMERTAMLNIWYVYFALTGTPLSTEALEMLKENPYYAKGELLVKAYE